MATTTLSAGAIQLNATSLLTVNAISTMNATKVTAGTLVVPQSTIVAYPGSGITVAGNNMTINKGLTVNGNLTMVDSSGTTQTLTALQLGVLKTYF